VPAAKGRRLCRAGIHAFAQRLKKDFSADGDHIEIEVRLLQTVLEFYEIKHELFLNIVFCIATDSYKT
jgi:hypothetical protein